MKCIQLSLLALGSVVAAPAQAQDVPARIAVTSFAGQGVDEETKSFMMELFAAELTRQGGFQVVTQESLRKVIELEQGRQAFSAESEDWSASVRDMLKTKQLATGTIELVDGEYRVSLQLMESSRLEVSSRISFGAPRDRDALEAATRKGVGELLRRPPASSSGRGQKRG